MFRQNEIVAQDPATDGCYRNSTVRLNCHLLLIVQRNYAKYARLRVMLKLSYTMVVSVELLIINPEVLRERQPQRRGPPVHPPLGTPCRILPHTTYDTDTHPTPGQFIRVRSFSRLVTVAIRSPLPSQRMRPYTLPLASALSPQARG